MGTSVLLERKAGENQEVVGQLKLNYGYGIEKFIPEKALIEFWIGNQSYGIIEYGEHEATLLPLQVSALLNSAKKNDGIYFTYKGQKWTLSSKGMSAVLLKMDEFQKRLNTAGELIKQGDLPEDDVLKAAPIPVLSLAKTEENNETLKAHYNNHRDKLADIGRNFFNTDEDEDCWALSETEQEEYLSKYLSIYPLNKDKALIEHSCWLAAYNAETAYWVVDKDINLLEVVTLNGAYYQNGNISISYKGRGIGDCWWFQTYSWNGESFILTSSLTTGMCRGEVGGFWQLPTIVYDVIP